MSQIANDLSHINRIRKALEADFKAQKIPPAVYYDTDLRYLNIISRHLNSAITIMVAAAQHGAAIKNQADRTGVFGKNVAIYTGDPEIEMVKCPDKDDALIPRAECLDYSGSNESCSTCSNKKETQNRLLKAV